MAQMELDNLSKLERGEYLPAQRADSTYSTLIHPWASNSRSTTIKSQGSTGSRRSRKFFRRSTASSIREIWDERMESAMPIGRQDFLRRLCCDTEPSIMFPECAFWFTIYLEAKLKNFWTLCRRGLVGVNETTPQPSEGDITAAYRLLIAIWHKLSTTKEVSLARMTDQLINETLLKDAETDEELENRHVLVFTLLGFVTTLYEPRPLTQGKPGTLQVAKHTMTSSGELSPLNTWIISTKSQNFEYTDQPLYIMLGVFGSLIPEPVRSKKTDYTQPSESITAACLCYHTLRKVCGIKIEWVETLAMHLEFDAARKVLKLYRLPSVCFLMYRARKKRGLFDQLYWDKAKELNTITPSECEAPSAYFKEILMTYRLIFGQDTQSWKLFGKDMAGLGASSILQREDRDPILQTLCGEASDSTKALEIYDYIHADDVLPYYIPNSFPFFAKNLLALQVHVEKATPHNWRALWHDSKRNVGNWWAFWAVLFIGGCSIILMAFSLALQAWQVRLAQQQIGQVPSSLP